MKKYRESIVILFVIFILSFLLYSLTVSPHDVIKEWTSQRNEKVVDTHSRWLLTGPYFPTKNTMVYRVVTDKTIYWFRFGLWTDIYQEISPGNYKKLK